jgi:hypothetical protein
VRSYKVDFEDVITRIRGEQKKTDKPKKLEKKNRKNRTEKKKPN